MESLQTSAFKSIDIAKLVPGFMNIEKGESLDKALKYIINHCIESKRCKEKTVHNLAFYFLSERERPDDLLNYLAKEEAKSSSGLAIYFEIDYALNVCK